MQSLFRRLTTADGLSFAVLQTVVTQLLVLLLNVASGILVARLLGPEGRGIYTAAILWPQFLSAGIAFGVPNSATYFIKNNHDQRSEIVSSALVLTALMSLIGVVIGVILVRLLMNGQSELAMRLALVSVLGTVPYLATNTLRQIFVTTGHVGVFNSSSYLPPALYISVVVLGFFLIGHVTAETCVLAQLWISLLVCLWLALRLTRLHRLTTRGIKPWLGRVAGYALRAGPVDVITAVSGNLDRLVLVSMISLAELGTYAVAYSLSRIVLVVQTSVTSLLLAKMVGLPEDDIRRLHDQALRLVISMVFVLLCGTGFLGRWLLTMFYGPAFGAAAPVFFLLVTEAALSCIGQVVVQLYLSLGRPGFVSIAHVTVFFVLLPMLLVLVSHFGSVGAAFALVVAAALRLGILLAGIRLSLKLPFPRLWPVWSDISNVRAYIRSG